MYPIYIIEDLFQIKNMFKDFWSINAVKRIFTKWQLITFIKNIYFMLGNVVTFIYFQVNTNVTINSKQMLIGFGTATKIK